MSHNNHLKGPPAAVSSCKFFVMVIPCELKEKESELPFMVLEELCVQKDS